VVDRKKELIVTSGGKKISPVHLETALKELRLVSNAAVIGTDRPFLVALLVVDAEVRRDENVEQEVTHGVDVVNAALAPHERIRRWRVVHDDWAADSELLTPTMKLKRRAVEAKYASEIEALYGNRTKLRTVEDR
jgi:long-chain acyl-CoA synthetase